MAIDKITIQIYGHLWLELNKRKEVGENFNDVIERLLKFSISFEQICNLKGYDTKISDIKKLTKEMLG